MTIDYPWTLCKRHGLNKPNIHKLTQDVFLEQWIIPKDTEVRAFETKDFGYIIIPSDCRDKRGFLITKHIFRY